MRLSARARYAVRLMLEVCRHGTPGEPVRLSAVAESTGISRKFLEQLVIPLKSHGLLRAKCGRKGGYALARSAENIKVGEVIGAVVGPLSLSVCVDEPNVCMYSDDCECRLIWSLLQTRIEAVLNEFSLTDLLTKTRLEAIREELVIVDAAKNADGPPCLGAAGTMAPACARVQSQDEEPAA